MSRAVSITLLGAAMVTIALFATSHVVADWLMWAWFAIGLMVLVWRAHGAAAGLLTLALVSVVWWINQAA